MQLGKFDNDRDAALDYLCSNGWSNDSFGTVEAPTGFVWRISNNWEEVKPTNGEFNSVMEEWFELNSDVADTGEFRRSLVGHFILVENDQGFVSVSEFDSESEMLTVFDQSRSAFEDWDLQTEPCEWFVNRATVPAWCCNTHMYDGTGDFPATEEHPDICPFVEQ